MVNNAVSILFLPMIQIIIGFVIENDGFSDLIVAAQVVSQAHPNGDVVMTNPGWIWGDIHPSAAFET